MDPAHTVKMLIGGCDRRQTCRKLSVVGPGRSSTTSTSPQVYLHRGDEERSFPSYYKGNKYDGGFV